MTIQVKINENDLRQKLQIVSNLGKYFSDSKHNTGIFDYAMFIRNIVYCQERIDRSGNFEEIYSDLQHIERILLEQI